MSADEELASGRYNLELDVIEKEWGMAMLLSEYEQSKMECQTNDHLGKKGIVGDLVFFFQAEDGIRDLTVTGVQTCALPICWQRIGKAMPRKVGDIGFPIVLHPTDPDTAWVLPMDGQSVWPRTSVGGRPAVYGTGDGGASWRRMDRGLPRSQAWFTVLRQAMCADTHARPGVYFGTTGGEVWASTNGGGRWRGPPAPPPGRSPS